jgi:hypothetical protein
MSFSNYLETKVLDHVFGATAYTAPATLYVGLYTATPMTLAAAQRYLAPVMLGSLLLLLRLEIQLAMMLPLSSQLLALTGAL